MADDPVKSAKELAARAIEQRVTLIQELTDALAWENKLGSARSQLKAAVADAPSETRTQADRVLTEMDRLMESAQKNTKDARQAARSQWSRDELREMGLIRTRRSTGASKETSDQPANVDPKSSSSSG